MSTFSTTQRANTPGPLLRQMAESQWFVYLLSALLFTCFAPFTPGMATGGNLGNLLDNLIVLGTVAVGQTVVLIAGGIDLSVTSIIALSSVVGAMAMNGDSGWLAKSPLAMPVGVILMIVVGAIIGWLNGFGVTKLKMPAFIVTLTSMMFFSGVAIWLTQSKSIYHLPESFAALGQKRWLALLIAGGLAWIAHVLLSRSLFGRWLYAVGGNAQTARVSGVPTDGVIIAAYVTSGVFAAIASVLYTARLETGSPTMGQRILLDVVAATVLGGTSLFGGKGKVVWTIGGVLFLTLLDNALNLLGLSHFTIMIVKGCVILAAAGLDTMRNGSRQS